MKKYMFHEDSRHKKSVVIILSLLFLAACTLGVCFNLKNIKEMLSVQHVNVRKVQTVLPEKHLLNNRKNGLYYIEEHFYYFENGKIVNINHNAIDPKRPVIALTFDDGPGKYTKTLLTELQKYNARATFFIVGTNAERYPEEIQMMKEIGCELGNHSTTHKKFTELDSEGIKSEIRQTDEAIAAAVGKGASLVRPPYGAVNDTVRESVDRPMIMWSLDTADWLKKDAEKIAEYVLNHAEDGDIILMHDIHKFSVDSVIQLLPKLTENGYQLVTVSELAAYKGIQLQDGVKYFSFY